MSQRHLARATAVAIAAAAAFLLVLCFSNHPQALERGEEGSASPHGTALHAGTVWRWRGVQRAGCCCVRRQAHRAGERSGGPGTVTMPPAWEEEVGGAEGGGSGNGTDGSGTARAVRRDPRRGREMVTVLVHVHWREESRGPDPAERSRPPSLNSRPNELDFYHNFLYSENLIKLSRFFCI